ncbi:MAG: excinuclease ABC subunit UvrA [Candidatus Binataceae bacterium]
MQPSIGIRGARTHNLQNISLDLPRGRLTVVTGVSGSGKSSLVFDTLYAEGQRRFVQSLSTYARLFLERMDRPDVDSISEIPPALALRQKNSVKNARSTVGSITEISDYLRLLFATAGVTSCPRCGGIVTRDSVQSAAAQVIANPGLYLFLAPFEVGDRPLAQALSYLTQNGYHRLYQDDAMVETTDFLAYRASRPGDDGPLKVVIDRVSVSGDESRERVHEALEKAFYLGGNRARSVRVERDNGNLKAVAILDFDRRFNCSRCVIAFPEPAPALFSPNSPLGACPACEGFGRTVKLDLAKVIPNPDLSIRQGLIAPWQTPAYSEMQSWMVACARKRGVRVTAPYREFTAEEREWLLNGEPGRDHSRDERWPGVHGFFRWMEGKRYKTHVRILLARYRRFVPCVACGGAKLRPEALNVRVAGKTIAEVGQLSIHDLADWIAAISRTAAGRDRVAVVLRELKNRIAYLTEVGLGYLTLERQARTLSGGEAQRIHLASALGSRLTGTLYVLDEPTVGLHARDIQRLLKVLRRLRDLGNTVVMVEHDPMMIAGADHVVELGPGGGREGGNLVREGRLKPAARRKLVDTPGRVLLMRAIARERRFSKRAPALRIVGAREHNLKNLDVSIPLGRFVCVTGVSGSGKSSLVEEVLYRNYLQRTGQAVSDVGACDRIEGLEQLGEIVHMGQEMPTRSLRSNPATYLKVYDEVRKLLASTAEARRLGIQPRHFSFNVAGGRCERCQGSGTVTIEMHFMSDLEVTCEACDGRRFQSHILSLQFQGRNINQILALTVDEARAFFARYPKIVKPLEALSAVGLGYLELGQATSTLSGGEAQRLKLARCLPIGTSPSASADSERKPPSMFILDEPTTGLSSSDIRKLLKVLDRLVAEGNTLLVIEHNLEFIAHADYLIDLGPEGGDGGGRVIAEGGPVAVASREASHTARALRRLFGLPVDAGARAVRSALRSAAAL